MRSSPQEHHVLPAPSQSYIANLAVMAKQLPPLRAGVVPQTDGDTVKCAGKPGAGSNAHMVAAVDRLTNACAVVDVPVVLIGDSLLHWHAACELKHHVSVMVSWAHVSDKTRFELLVYSLRAHGIDGPVRMDGGLAWGAVVKFAFQLSTEDAPIPILLHIGDIQGSDIAWGLLTDDVMHRCAAPARGLSRAAVYQSMLLVPSDTAAYIQTAFGAEPGHIGSEATPELKTSVCTPHRQLVTCGDSHVRAAGMALSLRAACDVLSTGCQAPFVVHAFWAEMVDVITKIAAKHRLHTSMACKTLEFLASPAQHLVPPLHGAVAVVAGEWVQWVQLKAEIEATTSFVVDVKLTEQSMIVTYSDSTPVYVALVPVADELLPVISTIDTELLSNSTLTALLSACDKCTDCPANRQTRNHSMIFGSYRQNCLTIGLQGSIAVAECRSNAVRHFVILWLLVIF